jgi:cellulose synthase operon protein C
MLTSRILARACFVSVVALVVGLAAGARAEPVAAPVAGAKAEVDVSALRYYWASGQTARMDAESRRLKRLYPDWKAPDFLQQKPEGAVTSGEDELDLWDLFAADKLDELDKTIAERRVEEPGWEPSADLKAKIEVKRFRFWISGQTKSGHYAEIVKRLETSKLSLAGLDLDVLWMVAEAYQTSRHSDKALAIYKGILKSEVDPAKRLATVQKALGGLRMDDFEQVLALAEQGVDGKSEFASLELDIARARIAAFLHDEREAPVEDSDLKIFADYAREAKDPNQPALLAWYFYKLRNYSQTLEWFKLGLTHGGDAMVAHGLALTLGFLGQKRDAEEVAYAWRQPLVNNSILFIDTLGNDLTKPIPPYVEPARLQRYAEVTGMTSSGEGAQALGWYAYNTCQFDVAAQWFERAVAWFPKEGSVYGLALSLRKIKKGDEANKLINRYDGLFPSVVGLLFPDDAPHPPTACETQNANMRKRPNNPLAGEARMIAAPSWLPVAPPVAVEAKDRSRMPRIPRNVFPISVDAENPYRFAPEGSPKLVNAAVGSDPPAEPGGFALDPASPLEPLVARRVPGVGAMPYERYGYTLLPGYNGATAPSTSIAAMQTAPAGTVWSRERAQPAQGDATAQPTAAAGATGPSPYAPAAAAVRPYSYGAPLQILDNSPRPGAG